MLPVLFINCSRSPFVADIMNRSKIYETRSRDMLRSLVGKRVLIAETGTGSRSVVRCSARIVNAFRIDSFDEWDMFRDYTRVPAGSVYDWKPGTRCKWLYELDSVVHVSVPFHPAEGVRHGRVWMETTGRLSADGLEVI